MPRTTRSYCSLLFLVLAACSADQGQVSESDNVSRPNFLIIMTDDMGYGDYSNIGNPYLRTPNLDRMSRESVNFKNFYVSSVCAPTRASLLTVSYTSHPTALVIPAS